MCPASARLCRIEDKCNSYFLSWGQVNEHVPLAQVPLGFENQSALSRLEKNTAMLCILD